jgi:hypothetical protein
MRLPTFAYHAPKAFEQIVKIKCDFTRSALIITGDPTVIRAAKDMGEAVYTVDSLASRSLVGKILPSSYSHTEIKEYYSEYAQYRRHRTSQVWPKSSMGLRACVSH